MSHDDTKCMFVDFLNKMHKSSQSCSLLVNNLTNIVIPTYFKFIQMPSIDTKFGIFYNPNIYLMNHCRE